MTIRHAQPVAMLPFAAVMNTIVYLTGYASGRMERFGRGHAQIRTVSPDIAAQSLIVNGY